MANKNLRIVSRVSETEKKKIESLANKCGLSITEYVKQRALGYEPKTVPPDALFVLLEKNGELEDKTNSSETDIKITELLNEIASTFLLPGKENTKLWQSQDSGP